MAMQKVQGHDIEKNDIESDVIKDGTIKDSDISDQADIAGTKIKENSIPISKIINFNVIPGINTYTFDQIAPQTIWDINHNLNKFCSVTIVDSAGSVVVGDINYVSSNRIIITFSSAFSGKAYLN